MIRLGTAVLPLHPGWEPRYLFQRMKRLGAEIVSVIIEEFGRDELLRRLSNPFWFQSLGCALGYDWHSSGVTTVLTAVLREAIDPKDTGIAVCGGKGKRLKLTPNEIQKYGTLFQLTNEQVRRLIYTSRIVAKVDNAAIQADYQLYHHSFIMTVEANWSVIQQGMSTSDNTARRYHWLSENAESLVNEPHDAIVGESVRQQALDMTSSLSQECRNASIDLVKEGIRRVRTDMLSMRPEKQRTLTDWIPDLKDRPNTLQTFRMPRRVDWNAIRRAYEFQPKNYEELLNIEGIGPGAIRA